MSLDYSIVIKYIESSLETPLLVDNALCLLKNPVKRRQN